MIKLNFEIQEEELEEFKKVDQNFGYHILYAIKQGDKVKVKIQFEDVRDARFFLDSWF